MSRKTVCRAAAAQQVKGRVLAQRYLNAGLKSQASVRRRAGSGAKPARASWVETV